MYFLGHPNGHVIYDFGSYEILLRYAQRPSKIVPLNKLFVANRLRQVGMKTMLLCHRFSVVKHERQNLDTPPFLGPHINYLNPSYRNIFQNQFCF